MSVFCTKGKVEPMKFLVYSKKERKCSQLWKRDTPVPSVYSVIGKQPSGNTSRLFVIYWVAQICLQENALVVVGENNAHSAESEFEFDDIDRSRDSG